MRAITWVELEGTWYGVLSRAGQVIPEGKPNYGVIAYEITPGYGDDDSAWAVSDRIGGGGLRQRAQGLTQAKAMCSMWFKEFLEARGLLAQVDLDYDRVFAEMRGFWKDLGAIAADVGSDFTYERIQAALKLLIADGKVEVKDTAGGAPVYRGTLA